MKKITEMTKAELINGYTNLFKKNLKVTHEEFVAFLSTSNDEVAREKLIASEDWKKTQIRDVNRSIRMNRFIKELIKRGYGYDMFDITQKITMEFNEELFGNVIHD